MFEAVCRADIGHEEALGSLSPPLLCHSTEGSGPRTHVGRPEAKKRFHTTSSELWTAVTGELIIIILMIIIKNL